MNPVPLRRAGEARLLDHVEAAQAESAAVRAHSLDAQAYAHSEAQVSAANKPFWLLLQQVHPSALWPIIEVLMRGHV